MLGYLERVAVRYGYICIAKDVLKSVQNNVDNQIDTRAKQQYIKPYNPIGADPNWRSPEGKRWGE